MSKRVRRQASDAHIPQRVQERGRERKLRNLERPRMKRDEAGEGEVGRRDVEEELEKEEKEEG